MSELRRGWWKENRPVWTSHFDGKRRIDVTPEEMQHVRDMAAFIEGPCHMEHAKNLINRGTPPEPEWLPVGVPPDREGRWERMSRHKKNEFLAVSKRGQGFWASFESGFGAPVHWLNHDGIRYRRIGDL